MLQQWALAVSLRRKLGLDLAPFIGRTQVQSHKVLHSIQMTCGQLFKDSSLVRHFPRLSYSCLRLESLWAGLDLKISVGVSFQLFKVSATPATLFH